MVKIYIKRQISKCLKNSVLGLKWDIPNAQRKKPYLCSHDTDVLVSETQEAYEYGTPFDTYELLDRALQIREERISRGIQFLTITGSEQLAVGLLLKISKPPSRSWINPLLARTHLQLRDRR